MQLKPQDILVLLKLIAIGQQDWAYNRLAIELGMSPSEVHAAIKRSLESGLALQRDKKIIPNVRNLEGFLCHGIRYVFVVPYLCLMASRFQFGRMLKEVRVASASLLYISLYL